MSSAETLDGKPMFTSEYIGASDLQGKPATITIKDVQKVEVFNQQANRSEKKTVIIFAGKESDRKMVVNKTNSKLIAKALNETEGRNWVGRQITIYPTKCPAFGSQVDCIRVREAKGQ